MQSDFWQIVPQRAFDWELQADERVVIFVPKFRHPVLQRYLLPLLKKPLFRIQLDALGSMFWTLTDGSRTLEEIKLLMHSKFGEQLEPVDERFGKFVRQLYAANLIKFYNSHNQ